MKISPDKLKQTFENYNAGASAKKVLGETTANCARWNAAISPSSSLYAQDPFQKKFFPSVPFDMKVCHPGQPAFFPALAAHGSHGANNSDDSFTDVTAALASLQPTAAMA